MKIYYAEASLIVKIKKKTFNLKFEDKMTLRFFRYKYHG